MTVACVRSSQLCLPGSLPTAKLPDAAVQQLKAATLPMQGNMYDLFLSSAGWGGADATRGGLYEFQLATILGDPQNAEELCQAVATLRYEIPELCVGDDGDPEKFLQKIPRKMMIHTSHRSCTSLHTSRSTSTSSLLLLLLLLTGTVAA